MTLLDHFAKPIPSFPLWAFPEISVSTFARNSAPSCYLGDCVGAGGIAIPTLGRCRSPSGNCRCLVWCIWQKKTRKVHFSRPFQWYTVFCIDLLPFLLGRSSLVDKNSAALKNLCPKDLVHPPSLGFATVFDFSITFSFCTFVWIWFVFSAQIFSTRIKQPNKSCSHIKSPTEHGPNSGTELVAQTYATNWTRCVYLSVLVFEWIQWAQGQNIYIRRSCLSLWAVWVYDI